MKSLDSEDTSTAIPSIGSGMSGAVTSRSIATAGHVRRSVAAQGTAIRHPIADVLTDASPSGNSSPLGTSKQEMFWLMNKWQGQVQTVGRDELSAVLYDLERPDLIETGDFALNDITPEDRVFLRPGAIFYWYIGYRDTLEGRKRESFIWFQRSGRMSDEEFAQRLESVRALWDQVTGVADEPRSASSK